MDITVTIVPSGNTTTRELAALASETTQALRGLRDVQQVVPVRGTSPDGAKGVAELIGAFLLSVPPSAITGAFDVLRGVLARSPDTPTTVKVSRDGSVELTFDPRHATPEQMVDLVQKLRAT